jgi:hypothetical protein
MSIPFIVPRKSEKEHIETLTTKICAFPGCKIRQKMTGKGKYCTEHRNRKYRKIIDADKNENIKIEEEAANINQIIKHNFTEATKMFLRCQLNGCGKDFEVNAYPHIFVFPKYC